MVELSRDSLICRDCGKILSFSILGGRHPFNPSKKKSRITNRLRRLAVDDTVELPFGKSFCDICFMLLHLCICGDKPSKIPRYTTV